MLADAGATAVIVGHSERRIDHGETDSLVNAKALAAYRAGLTAIICIGETEAQHRDGETLDVLKRQLRGSVPEEARAANTVIAYEPVWAIGSGLTPTPADVAEVHGFIRGRSQPIARAERERRHAAPLRRLGEARQRRPNSSSCPTSTAPWSAAQASRPMISTLLSRFTGPEAKRDRPEKLLWGRGLANQAILAIVAN